MLEINALSLVNNGVVNTDSPTWSNIHSSVADFVSDAGGQKKLHVRFYHSDYTATRASTERLHTEIKRTLADLPIYVVMADEKVRNDKVPWNAYLSRYEAPQ